MKFWIIKNRRSENHCYHFSISSTFHGLGFILSTANPITTNDFFLFEVRFLWIKFWYTYYL